LMVHQHITLRNQLHVLPDQIMLFLYILYDQQDQ
jgi:hypothetical protein